MIPRNAIGLGLLRWGVWLLLAWVFVRGVSSFLPSPAPAAATQSQNVPSINEPIGLRAFPAMFVREYLSWSAASLDSRADRLRPYLEANLYGQAEVKPVQNGVAQRVQETWVYDAHAVDSKRWVVTVAARVSRWQEGAVQAGDPMGGSIKPLPDATFFLAIPVSETADGGLVVTDYPALLPEPLHAASGETLPPGTAIPDQGDRVRNLMTEFFHAYFGSQGDVTYYLVPGAMVRTVQGAWTLVQVEKVTLFDTATGRRAQADVLAEDQVTGARYTYRYLVDLVDRDGRWYITAMAEQGD